MLRVNSPIGEAEYHNYIETTDLLWSILTDNQPGSKVLTRPSSSDVVDKNKLVGEGFEILNRTYSRVRERYVEMSDLEYEPHVEIFGVEPVANHRPICSWRLM